MQTAADARLRMCSAELVTVESVDTDNLSGFTGCGKTRVRGLPIGIFRAFSLFLPLNFCCYFVFGCRFTGLPDTLRPYAAIASIGISLLMRTRL
jgi:hypothetical protein